MTETAYTLHANQLCTSFAPSSKHTHTQSLNGLKPFLTSSEHFQNTENNGSLVLNKNLRVKQKFIFPRNEFLVNTRLPLFSVFCTVS